MKKLIDLLGSLFQVDHSYYIEREYIRITRVGRFSRLDA